MALILKNKDFALRFTVIEARLVSALVCFISASDITIEKETAPALLTVSNRDARYFSLHTVN
jgi:hypothetical protein